jgi:hypothetical protein
VSSVFRIGLGLDEKEVSIIIKYVFTS